MKKIQRRAQEQLELINTTLNLSRLETGQLSLDAKDVKVADLIDEVDGETRWLQGSQATTTRAPERIGQRSPAMKWHSLQRSGEGSYGA